MGARAWPLLIGTTGLCAGLWQSSSSDTFLLFISGDANGNLAPCGCTKPMTGGIKRRITAAKNLSIPGRTTYVDNGGFVTGIGRQDQMKAQTAAEILGAAGWNAINVSPSDARLGLGMILSMSSLSRGAMLASGVTPSDGVDLKQYVISQPFLIIGVATHSEEVSQALGQVPISIDDAVRSGIEQAKEGQLTPIVLLQGSIQDAKNLATKFPTLKLIVYRSEGSPPISGVERQGPTCLVTPGADGKYLIRLSYARGQFSNYTALALGPQYADDAVSSRIYREYLHRVSSEKLLQQLPRMKTEQYSGTETCGVCHSRAQSVWHHSLHAKALRTLAGRAEDRDPDCLPCHVVGLSSQSGFKSLKETPGLANVGCESCHGPSANHVANPKTSRLPKVTATTCISCHTPNTSPNFNFSSYWKKIQH